MIFFRFIFIDAWLCLCGIFVLCAGLMSTSYHSFDLNLGLYSLKILLVPILYLLLMGADWRRMYQFFFFFKVLTCRSFDKSLFLESSNLEWTVENLGFLLKNIPSFWFFASSSSQYVLRSYLGVFLLPWWPANLFSK